jgi:FkbM family methyltransferase
MKRIIKIIINKLGFELKRIDTKSIGNGKKTKRLTLYKTDTGKYYLPTDAKKDTIADHIINDQVFEKEVVDLAKLYIKPDTCVLDIGANFGQMSILFSEIVGEKGKIYSFEADDWIFEILNKNVTVNKKNDVIKTHFGAVHNNENEILLFPEQDFVEFGTYGSYGIDYNSKEGREVKTITIDSLCITEKISFIKIDIQGGDLMAMQGAINTIKRNKCPIIFEYEYQLEQKYNFCFQNYVDFVESINYKFHRVINGHNYLIIPDNR